MFLHQIATWFIQNNRMFKLFHILWEFTPSYYGNVFSYIVRLLSHNRCNHLLY